MYVQHALKHLFIKQFIRHSIILCYTDVYEFPIYKHIYLFLFLCCISSIKNAAMLLHLPHTFMYEHFPKTNENERAVAREIHTRKILKIQFLILILLQ